MSYRSERSVRREVSELVLALANDTVQKMNSEVPEHDRTYLLEDLITRLALVAKENGADLSLFPDVEDSMRVTPAYPLVDTDSPYAEELEGVEETHPARGVASVPLNRGHFGPVSDAPLVSAETIRQAHNLLRFDGVQRHPFEASHSGMVCGRMVMRNGAGEDCGLPAAHAIHDYQEAK